MCCIFTCISWCVDAVQRAWVFAMSCCIGAAICVMLLVASVSGVALGYNYSMSEFVELKETNVSVFLKRGVFDDAVVEEMDWRRGGGGPPSAARSGSNRESDSESSMRKSMPSQMYEAEPTVPPGRRLDDAIIMSDNSQRFEGALMKLTGAAANLVEVATETTEIYYQLSTTPIQESLFAAYAPVPAQRAHEDLKNSEAMLNRRMLDMNPTPLHGQPTTEMATLTVHGSSFENPLHVRRYGEEFYKEANQKLEKGPLLDRFKESMFITNMMGLPPGPYGDFMKRQYASLGYAPVNEAMKMQMTIGEFDPKADLQNRWAMELTSPFTDSGVVYNTEKKKFTTEENTEGYEGTVVVNAKAGSKSSDTDYDEDDIKGLPMRRKREVKYVTPALRKLKTASYRPYRTNSNEDFTERKAVSLLPKGSSYKSNMITTLFRKSAS